MIRYFIYLSLLCLGMIYMGGCATLKPGIRTRHFLNGIPDPSFDKSVAQKAKTIKEAKDVIVMEGKLPEGVMISKNGNHISIDKGFRDVYKVIGTAESDYSIAGRWAFVRNMYWTWNYDEKWRRAICWPQVPLKIVTLGWWNIIPLAYPCVARMPQEETERRLDHIKTLQKAAKAMGGNMVIMTKEGNLEISTINRGTGKVIRYSTIEGIKVRGFVLRFNKKQLEKKLQPAPATEKISI